MIGTKSNITAGQIVALSDEAKAIPTILSGVLDAKIKETKAAIADFEKRQGVVKTLDQAEAVLKSAQAKVDAAVGEAQAKVKADAAAAATLMEQATAKMKGADAREKETADGLARLIVERNQLIAAKAQIATKTAELDARTLSLDGLAASLTKRQAKLTADQQAFNKKLEALKV
jgi:hypothetical protein